MKRLPAKKTAGVFLAILMQIGSGSDGRAGESDGLVPVCTRKSCGSQIYLRPSECDELPVKIEDLVESLAIEIGRLNPIYDRSKTVLSLSTSRCGSDVERVTVGIDADRPPLKARRTVELKGVPPGLRPRLVALCVSEMLRRPHHRAAFPVERPAPVGSAQPEAKAVLSATGDSAKKGDERRPVFLLDVGTSVGVFSSPRVQAVGGSINAQCAILPSWPIGIGLDAQLLQVVDGSPKYLFGSIGAGLYLSGRYRFITFELGPQFEAGFVWNDDSASALDFKQVVIFVSGRTAVRVKLTDRWYGKLTFKIGGVIDHESAAPDRPDRIMLSGILAQVGFGVGLYL